MPTAKNAIREYHFTSKEFEYADPSEEQIDSRDLMDAVYKALPDKAKPVFEIICGIGETYDYWLLEYQSQIVAPQNRQLCKFLGINNRQLLEILSIVKHYCLIKGLG